MATIEKYSELELDDSMIPDGYGADDLLPDITEADGKEEPEETEGKSEDTHTKDDEEKPEEETEKEDQQKESVDKTNTEEPEKETVPEKRKLKFKAKVDHKDVDAEIDEDELPSIYQKAQNHDRMQKKLSDAENTGKEWDDIARLLGYGNSDAMRKSIPESYRKSEIQKLIDKGVDEEVAEETVANKMKRILSEKPAEPQREEKAEEPKYGERDFKSELAELYQFHPELQGEKLPDEVVSDVTRNGKRVVVAYQEYLDSKKEKELAAAKKENKILKQNAAATAKAPVKGVSGGAELSKLSKVEQRMMKAFDDDD